jgi:hypothetical protein
MFLAIGILIPEKDVFLKGKYPSVARIFEK